MKEIKDLRIGMELEGVVTNITQLPGIRGYWSASGRFSAYFRDS